MKIKLIAAAVAAIHLSGCATIVSGSNQDIAFSAADASSKTCTATGGSKLAMNERFTTPAVLQVKRSKKDIDVSCTDGSSETVLGEYNAWTLGNFFNLTGFLGIGIDAVTGAVHKYPEDVVLGDDNMAMSMGITTPTVTGEAIMP